MILFFQDQVFHRFKYNQTVQNGSDILNNVSLLDPFTLSIQKKLIFYFHLCTVISVIL